MWSFRYSTSGGWTLQGICDLAIQRWSVSSGPHYRRTQREWMLYMNVHMTITLFSSSVSNDKLYNYCIHLMHFLSSYPYQLISLACYICRQWCEAVGCPSVSILWHSVHQTKVLDTVCCRRQILCMPGKPPSAKGGTTKELGFAGRPQEDWCSLCLGLQRPNVSLRRNHVLEVGTEMLFVKVE